MFMKWMKNKKSIQNLLLIAFALFFAACFVIIVVADAVITGSQKEYSQNEEDTALTEIQFSSAGVLADSPAVTINGSVATVTEPGAYFITDRKSVV